MPDRGKISPLWERPAGHNVKKIALPTDLTPHSLHLLKGETRHLGNYRIDLVLSPVQRGRKPGKQIKALSL